MKTALLDAAFRLVSHSVLVQQASPHVLGRKAHLAELARLFPKLDSQTIQEAYARAQQLEEVAIEMAELARGPRNDHTGPPSNAQTLAQRCPGFSRESYSLAVNDGYVQTR